MERRRAVFLDRDGTINEERGYLYRREEFHFLPGAVEGMRLFQEMGYLLIVITNQSGVARGYCTESDVKAINGWMQERLEKQGVYLSQVLYCPHLPDAPLEAYKKTCSCRKPGLSLFYKAASLWNLDVDRCAAVGDRRRDLEICYRTKCRGYLIRKGPFSESEKMPDNRNIRAVDSLYEAACIHFSKSGDNISI